MIINPYIFGGLDPDAQAFITAASITDSTQISAINTLVVNLKGYGVWTKMKAIYPFVGGTASTHKWNLKDPRDLDAAFRLVFNGGWTHSATGAKPNGTNAYADTYLIPNNSLSINNGHISSYLRTNIEQQTCDIGAGVTFEQNILTRWTGLGFITVWGTYNSNSYIANSDSRGLFVNNRNSTTNTTGFKNGIKVLDFAQTSGLATGKIFLSAQSLSPITRYSSREQAFATIGDGLTDTEASNLYTAVQAYQTTLGRQV